MSELNPWNVHGPVKTLRTEWAEWDPAKEEWQAAKQPTLIRFRPDGQTAEVEHHNADGSISRTAYTYNEAGQILETRTQTADGLIKTIHSYDGSRRIVRTVSADENGNEVGSDVFSYDASGRKTGVHFHPGLQGKMAHLMEGEKPAVLFSTGGGPDPVTITTTYDEHDQPAEELIHNADHLLLRRTIYTRDSAGRLVKEEVQLGTVCPFPGIETRFKDAAPEARDSIMATIATIFGPNKALSATTYIYDQKGRQVERIASMGILGEHRYAFSFDDHDNPIEEINENTSRDVQLDEEGKPRPNRETSGRQRTKYVYKYDEKGNWAEREVGTIVGPDIYGSNQNFQRSNIERRQITYYQSEQH